MNLYLYQFFQFFDDAAHPAAGRENVEQRKKKSENTNKTFFASPESIHLRARASKESGVRKNPSP